MNKSDRRKLRRDAKRAVADEGHQQAYIGRWIRRAETSGVSKRSAHAFSHPELEVLAVDHEAKTVTLGKPGSSFVLSEVEEAK